MPRHYTDEEKRLVLDRLIANHGDVARTVEETGVPMRTLYNWQKDANLPLPKLLPDLPSTSDLLPSPVVTGEGLGLGVSSLPTATAEAFQTLHDKLLAIADTLSNRIIEAIDDAPLNQRMTALSQLIDRIAKLAALLPEYEDDDPDDKPFEIDYDVEPKEDDDDQEEDEEKEASNSPAPAASLPEENSGKYSPF